MDGKAPPSDPLVLRAAQIGRICRGFGCLPSAAALELDQDPDQLALVILDMWGYQDAKHAFDNAKDKVDGLRAWTGNPYMTQVQTNTFEMKQDDAAGR